MAPEISDDDLKALQNRAEAGQQATTDLDAARGELTTAQQGTAAATAALLETTKAANPTIPADLIAGDDPAAIAASVERGKGIVEQVTSHNAANGKTDDTKTKLPGSQAGAPPRGDDQPPDNLRGAGRIAYALQKNADERGD